MPDSRMIYKAGKFSFLLVCLFLCAACRKQQTVFEAAGEPVYASREEKTVESVAEPEEKPDTGEKISDTQMVNINTADAKELMTLPGIGKVRAAAIIEYRQKEGNFETIEDIMKVKGIKTGIFSKINSLICVK